MNNATKKVRSLSGIILRNELKLNIGVIDIIYAFICYIMSSCEIMSGRTPFVLCAYAAAFSKGKWAVFLIISCLGVIRYRMDFAAVIYIGALVTSTAVMGLYGEKDNFRGVCVSLAYFTLALCSNIVKGFMWDVFVLDFLESTICFASVMIINSALTNIFSKTENPSVTQRDIFCVYIAAALLIRCTLPLPLVFGINISAVLAVLYVMLLGAGDGGIFALAAGVFMGIALYDGTASLSTSAGTFAMAALCSSVLKGFGKWGTVFGFVASYTVLIAFFSSEVLPYDIFEIIIASAVFAVLPSGFISHFSVSGEKIYEGASVELLTSNKLQRVITSRLDKLSDAYRALSHSYEKCFETRNLSKGYIIHMLDIASSKICPDCGLKYNCWERNYKETYRSMLKMLEIAENNGVVTCDDVPQAMRQKCIKMKEFLEAFNRMYEVYKVEKLWQTRFNDSRMLVSGLLEGIGHSVKKLSFDFDLCLDTLAENELKKCLLAEGIEFVDITFLKGEREYFRVEILLSSVSFSESDEQLISNAIKKVTQKEVSRFSIRYLTDGIQLTFKPTPTYTVTSACAAIPRYGEKICGDSYTLCENYCGEFVAALSDGMGTGQEASGESLNAVELLENFMMAGMEVETALELINSALLLRSSGDSFATMDVCVVNPDEGYAQFSKSGAAPGYIKKSGETTCIFSSSLPFGVLSDYGTINTEIHTIDDGATVVMVSDGINDIFAGNKEKGLIQIIQNTDTDKPQVLSAMIMKEALRMCNGKPEDDMSVIVLCIKKA